jgi:hypothetical protein
VGICSAWPKQNENQTLSGAYGCRVRRIKCDETRPHCVRCTSTGRKCDGYAEQGPTPILPDSSLTVLTINRAAGHVPECRAFDFFRTCTLPNISLHFGSPPWIRLLLQASHSEPALQHAAIALGALHEHLENGNTSTYQPITHRDHGIDYASQRYTQALISLSTLLTKSDNRSIELALIGGLMCMYYEVLQENFETAQVHLENCLMVLQPMLPSQRHNPSLRPSRHRSILHARKTLPEPMHSNGSPRNTYPFRINQPSTTPPLRPHQPAPLIYAQHRRRLRN